MLPVGTSYLSPEAACGACDGRRASRGVTVLRDSVRIADDEVHQQELRRHRLCRRRRFPKVVPRLCVQPAGRAGFVRYKLGHLDVTVGSVYFPPGRPEGIRDASLALVAWVRKVLDDLPGRTVILMGMDLNGRLGEPAQGLSDGTEWAKLAVGPEEAEPETHNGRLLRELLEQHRLTTVNTRHVAGPTFWSNLHAPSRIDFAVAPSSALGAVHSCRVLHRAGDRLQLVECQGPVDHSPLEVVCDVGLRYNGRPHETARLPRWDIDSIMYAIRTKDYGGFLDDVQKWVSLPATRTAWSTLLSGSSVDSLWQYVNYHLHRIAAGHFGRLLHQSFEATHDARRRRLRLLAERRDAREEYRRSLLPYSVASLRPVLRAWLCFCGLRKADRALRHEVRRAAASVRDERCAELEEAWRQRDLSRVWRMAVALSGKCRPKGRSHLAPPLTETDWTEGLCRPGRLGGCDARRTEMQPPCFATDSPSRRADGDLRRPVRFVKAAAPDLPSRIQEENAMLIAEAESWSAARQSAVVERDAMLDLYDFHSVEHPCELHMLRACAACRVLLATRYERRRARCLEHFDTVLAEQSRRAAADEATGNADVHSPAPEASTTATDRHLRRRALADVRGVARHVRNARCRKAVPSWALPNEVWRMVLAPSNVQPPKYSGVGWQQPSINDGAFSMMVDFHSFVRRRKTTPACWHLSTGYSLPKPSAEAKKIVFDRQRLVHSLDPYGKAFYRFMWHSGTPPAPRCWEHGYVSGRRREAPVMQAAVLLWRLRAAHRSHCLTSYDLANAFMSVKSEALTKVVRKVARDEDVGLLEHRHRRAATAIPVPSGWVVYDIGSGALPGDNIAADLFRAQHQGTMLRVLERARQDPRQRCMMAYNPVRDNMVECDVVLYADDLLRIAEVADASDASAKVLAFDAALDRLPDDEGMAQNVGKREHLLLFFGKEDALKHLRDMVADRACVPGRKLRQLRYLGSQLHRLGSNTPELNMRVSRTWAAWYALSGFWRCSAPHRVRRLVFQAAIVGTAISGLTSFVLSPAEVRKLETLIVKLGRKLMQGAACDKMASEGASGVSYVARNSAEVWRWLQLLPLGDELRVRRLKWIQHQVCFPEHYDALHSVVFGAVPFEVNGGDVGFFPACARSADPRLRRDADPRGAVADHPWLRQLGADLDALRALDEGDRLLALLEDGHLLRLWRDPEARSRFLSLDMAALRQAMLSSQVPPPGTTVMQSSQESRIDDIGEPQVGDFVCCLQGPEPGVACGRAFSTAAALSAHMRFSMDSSHGRGNLLNSLIITTQCPWCRSVFSTLHNAREHANRAYVRGTCRVDRGVV